MTIATMSSRYHPGLRKAIAAAGGVSALAHALALTKGAVSQWHRPPVDRCRMIAQQTGVPLWELRPDIWDAPGAQK